MSYPQKSGFCSKNKFSVADFETSLFMSNLVRLNDSKILSTLFVIYINKYYVYEKKK